MQLIQIDGEQYQIKHAKSCLYVLLQSTAIITAFIAIYVPLTDAVIAVVFDNRMSLISQRVLKLGPRNRHQKLKVI